MAVGKLFADIAVGKQGISELEKKQSKRGTGGKKMVGKACKTCCWYDPEYECTCPINEPWQCVYDEKAAAELDKAFNEWWTEDDK